MYRQFCFILGSIFFAKPMRERNYVTMLDPLQDKYGHFMTGLLLIAALLAEILWGATILMSLGKTYASFTSSCIFFCVRKNKNENRMSLFQSEE